MNRPPVILTNVMRTRLYASEIDINIAFKSGITSSKSSTLKQYIKDIVIYAVIGDLGKIAKCADSYLAQLTGIPTELGIQKTELIGN